MANVMVPQKKQPAFGLQQVMTLGGAGAGAFAGGLPGASAGASLGGIAGGMATPGAKEQAGVSSDAMSRRMQQIDNSPLSAIRDSIDSIQYLPDPKMQQEIAGPLVAAKLAAQKRVV